jgi:hypothetical protein
LLGVGDEVASLPNEAPGLLVSVENRTDRLAQMVVSYRDNLDAIDQFSVTLRPGDKSSQLLICPITEVTLGSVADLDRTGAVVALAPDLTGPIVNLPVLEVEPFGALLLEGVNYNCGDGLEFILRPSSTNRSGYETVALLRRSNAQLP